jgi:hypothetical protein
MAELLVELIAEHALLDAWDAQAEAAEAAWLATLAA